MHEHEHDARSRFTFTGRTRKGVARLEDSANISRLLAADATGELRERVADRACAQSIGDFRVQCAGFCVGASRAASAMLTKLGRLGGKHPNTSRGWVMGTSEGRPSYTAVQNARR